MGKLVWLIGLFVSCLAFAEEAVVSSAIPAATKGFLEQLSDGSFMAKIVAFGLAIQLVLYALGEALTRISAFTENKWDNKLASKISSIAWSMGVIFSKFGYSVPKLVVEEKAKQLSEKSSSSVK